MDSALLDALELRRLMGGGIGEGVDIVMEGSLGGGMSGGAVI